MNLTRPNNIRWDDSGSYLNVDEQESTLITGTGDPILNSTYPHLPYGTLLKKQLFYKCVHTSTYVRRFIENHTEVPEQKGGG